MVKKHSRTVWNRMIATQGQTLHSLVFFLFLNLLEDAFLQTESENQICLERLDYCPSVEPGWSQVLNGSCFDSAVLWGSQTPTMATGSLAPSDLQASSFFAFFLPLVVRSFSVILSSVGQQCTCTGAQIASITVILANKSLNGCARNGLRW